MVHWDLPRAPTGALLTTRLAERKGIPAKTCLRGTGLAPEDLSDPAVEVSATQEIAVIANVLRAAGDPPGLGVEAGTLFRLTAYGIWGFALVSSPTLRSAIESGLRFVDLTAALSEISAREVGAETELVLDVRDLPPEVRRFVLERDSAAIQTIQRDLFASPLPIGRISFAFPEPPPEALRQYDEVFGIRPEFGAGETIVAFEADLLDAPLPQANEITATVTLQQCRELLERREARSGVSGRVRDILLGQLSAPPDATEVATELHMSDRTLRHRLAAEGTTFRALLDEVRERLAEELLVKGGMSVAETARRLGYREVSSFSQAFRRWKGMGPRDYRKQASVTGI